MATKEHWVAQKERLFEPDLGPLAMLPMSIEAMRALGPRLAVGEALEFLVLGFEREAFRLLDSFLPTISNADFVAAIEKLDRRASVSESAHVAYWLRHGEFNLKLARSALRYHLEVNQWWGGRMTAPNTHGAMLLAIEAEEPSRAAQLYEENEKNRVQVPPENLRFARNSRSVLYLHIKDPQGTRTKRGMESFMKAATKWEKGFQPISYVGIVDAARTYHACQRLVGEFPQLGEVFDAVR